jgi:hypothetical protein
MHQREEWVLGARVILHQRTDVPDLSSMKMFDGSANERYAFTLLESEIFSYDIARFGGGSAGAAPVPLR